MTHADHFLELPYGRTRYVEAGRGDEHLILLHGMGIMNSADTFQFVIDDLGRHFHVYALDMLGFGKGTRTVPEGPTFNLLVDHVRQFMDALGIEQTHLLGRSAGGWVAGLLAYESPDRLRNLILLSPAGLNVEPSPGIRRSGRSLPDRDQLVSRTRGLVFDADAMPQERFARMVDVQSEVLKEPGALESLDPLQQQMETAEIRKRYLLNDRLAHIRVPTLFIWGEGDWMEPMPTWTQEYDSIDGQLERSSKPWIIPGAQYLFLRGVGHSYESEDPEGAVQTIVGFLKP